MGFDAGIAGHPAVAALAVLHAAALTVSIPASLRKRRAGTRLLGAALALNAALIAWNWIDYGRPPFKTLFETMDRSIST